MVATPKVSPLGFGRAGLLMLIAGGQAILGQSILLREASVLMAGNELAWGIVFAAWLAGIAVGAAFGGRLARVSQRAGLLLAVVLIGTNGLLATSLWFFREARPAFGIGPGEVFAPTMMALAALLLVFPCSILVGATFPLAVAAARPLGREPDGSARRTPGGSLGVIYAWESAGSLLGGAVFSFWAVEHLGPMQTVLICGCIAAAASVIVLWRGHWHLAALLFLGLTLILGAFALRGSAIDRRLSQRRWDQFAAGYQLVAEVNSKYQNLALGERAGQYSLFCDGQVATSFPDPWTAAPMAHLAMCEHPLPRRVLMIGGGAEGMLAEVLRHPVEHVDYLQTDPKELALMADHLEESDQAALRDSRVTVRYLDARHFIKLAGTRYDLVIARLPEPVSALRARFYTVDFYRELRAIMNDGGALFMSAAAGPTSLGPATALYLASIRAMLRAEFAEVIVGWGDPALILAATRPKSLAAGSAELVRRFVSRGVRSPYFDPAWFEGATDALDPAKLREREADLDRVRDVQISTDLHPAIFLQRLIMWEQATAAHRHRLMEWLMSARLQWLGGIVAVPVLWAGALALSRRKSAGMRRAVLFSISTTGFVTMALSIVWLFAFQSLYGYVYQRIGWIVALFMGGLVIGSSSGQRLSRSRPLALLIGVDAALSALALLAPIVLHVLLRASSALLCEVAISAGVMLTGVLGGAAFALAGRALAGEDPGKAAASVVGADHLGAAAGALLTGVFLVPVCGIPLTAVIIAFVKLIAVGVLLLVNRPAGVAKPYADGRVASA